MAPPFTTLYTTSFLLALVATLFVAATLRLLSILPGRSLLRTRSHRKPGAFATRVLVVLGSGGHTHEMFQLIRDLDTTRYTHRTYIVSSGDAFSAQRAAEFEKHLANREFEKLNEFPATSKIEAQMNSCTGPEFYNIATIPRARKIHQSLLTTPFTSLLTLLSAFTPLLGAPGLLPGQAPETPYEIAAQDVPDMIITNGPATGVIVILAALVLKFFNIKGCQSRGKCKTVYAESFARVQTLSLSGKLLAGVVDRFLVQWEELEGKGGFLGGKAEYFGILV